MLFLWISKKLFKTFWLRCTSPKVFPETPNEIYPILWRKSMSWQTLKLPEMRLEFASKYFL